MKIRIADELARDDLSNQIANCINDAISAYNNERFYFNETRDLLFTTVSGQEWYTHTDLPNLDNVLKIDYAFLIVGGYPYQLAATEPVALEALSVPNMSQGQSYQYAFYNQAIRLYPVPNSNSWQVRLGACLQAPPPPDDTTPGNPWVCDCERLIRSRAKYEMAVHVLYDGDLALAMGGTSLDEVGNPAGGQIQEALSSLRKKTKRLTQIGGSGFVKPMAF